MSNPNDCVSSACTVVSCLSDPDKQRRVYSRIYYDGGVFIVECNGCDFANASPACRHCIANEEEFWRLKHDANPHLNARQLTGQQPQVSS